MVCAGAVAGSEDVMLLLLLLMVSRGGMHRYLYTHLRVCTRRIHPDSKLDGCDFAYRGRRAHSRPGSQVTLPLIATRTVELLIPTSRLGHIRAAQQFSWPYTASRVVWSGDVRLGGTGCNDVIRLAWKVG
jgi:hypothetical protein